MPPSAPNGLLNWPSAKPASRAGSRGPTANTTCRCNFRISGLDPSAVGILIRAYTSEYPIPLSRAQSLPLAGQAKKESENATGKSSDNFGGKDREPLQLRDPRCHVDGVAEGHPRFDGG